MFFPVFPLVLLCFPMFFSVFACFPVFCHMFYIERDFKKIITLEDNIGEVGQKGNRPSGYELKLLKQGLQTKQ